jgi:CheY-like chemotaxis protein
MSHCSVPNGSSIRQHLQGQSMETTMEPESLILIVEDDSAALMMLTHILQDEGYRVVTAMNGLEGMRVCEEAPPSLILLDMWMPIMDGRHFVEGLRARGPKIPFLIMSAGRNVRHWAHDLGATGYLEKPFDIANAIAAVERLMPARSKRRVAAPRLSGGIGKAVWCRLLARRPIFSN